MLLHNTYCIMVRWLYLRSKYIRYQLIHCVLNCIVISITIILIISITYYIWCSAWYGFIMSISLYIHKYRIWYCINQVLLVLLLYLMVIAYWSINPPYIKYIYMICTFTLCKETNCGKFISVYQHYRVVISICIITQNPSQIYYSVSGWKS